MEDLSWLNWYSRKNAIENLDWSSFKNTDIFTFEENYTLHDSDIIDIISPCIGDILLVILLYTGFIDELKGYNSGQGSPILFLYFSKVKHFEISFDQRSGSEKMPFGINTMKSNINQNKNITETKFSSHYGDIMKILHKNDLQILLFDKDENIINLRKL